MMEKIEQSQVEVNGQKVDVAEIGSGSKVVVFLYGFFEMWHAWKHQMFAVAYAGYRAIAFNFRSYHGLSELPADLEKETYDIVHKIVGVLDTLNICKAFLVGKDFGGTLGYLTAMEHPNRVAAVITLCIPFALPSSYWSAKGETGLSDVKVSVPALLIMGEKGYMFRSPGMEEYIRCGAVKKFVPDLEIVCIPEGYQFVHEQFPEKVNQLIIEFLHKQSIHENLLHLRFV